MRTRILIVDGPARIEFDGWAGLAAEAGALRPVAEGAAQMVWPPAQADQPPALQIAGQARLAGGAGEIASLTVESPGAGRLEGQASFAAGGGALELRGRRFDLSAWLERHGEGPASPLLQTALSGVSAVGLALEQLAWRGRRPPTSRRASSGAAGAGGCARAARASPAPASRRGRRAPRSWLA